MSVRCAVVLAVVLGLGAAPVMASPTTRVPVVQLQQLILTQTVGVPGRVSQAVLQMPDSLRVRMLAAIARGDTAGAIALWELETGHQAPQWLQAMHEAFALTNQRAGPCIEVARSIFDGFRRLGANPSYLRFSAQGSRFLGFEMRAGKPSSTVQVSELQIHLVVQVKDRVYDAFTGPTGQPLSEYVKRLVTEEGATIASEVVASP